MKYELFTPELGLLSVMFHYKKNYSSLANIIGDCLCVYNQQTVVMKYRIVDRFVSLILRVIFERAGATFDWTLFDNSNRRKVVRRPSKVVMFDSDLVRRGSSNYRTLN
jgi:hypothetical protein